MCLPRTSVFKVCRLPNTNSCTKIHEGLIDNEYKEETTTTTPMHAADDKKKKKSLGKTERKETHSARVAPEPKDAHKSDGVDLETTWSKEGTARTRDRQTAVFKLENVNKCMIRTE